MSKFIITFVLNGKLNSVEISLQMAIQSSPVPINQVRQRLKYKTKTYNSYELNAAGIVLSKFPQANQIDIDFVDDDKKQDNKGGVLLLIAFVIALLIAPVLVTLGMHQKFILKGIYKKSSSHYKFAKFRKIYTILSFAYFGICTVLFIVFMIVGGNLPIALPLYLLVGGNVIGFIITIIYCRKLEKTLPKTTPSSFQNKSPNLAVGTSKSQPQQSVSKPVDSTKNLELSNLLLKYKELYDKQIISQEEYEKLKAATMASMIEEAPIEEEALVEEEIITENTQETSSNTSSNTSESPNSLDDYFAKYAKEHPTTINHDKTVVITPSKQENNVAYSSAAKVTTTKKVKRVKSKPGLFEIELPFEGAEKIFALRKAFDYYRVNSFFLLVAYPIFLAAFIVDCCITPIQFTYFLKIAFMVGATVGVILLCLTHKFMQSVIYKIIILIGLFYMPLGDLSKVLTIISFAIYILLALFTLIVLCKLANRRREALENHLKENLKSNPYASKRDYFGWDISKLSPENKWAAAGRINRIKTFDKIAFIFMCVAVGVVAISFIFMLVPSTYTFYDSYTHQYYTVSIIPIGADKPWRAALIIVFLILCVFLFALKLIFRPKGKSIIFEIVFGLISSVFFIFTSLGLYSAYGNSVVALIDIVSAIIVGLFYVITSPIRLTMRKNTKRFILINADKEISK